MSVPSTTTLQRLRVTEGVRVGLISLGCVRNTVDSETIMGALSGKGHTVVDEARADAVIVNTCGFIESAKKESIEVIGGLVRLKKEGRLRFIVVAGCLAQRYADELRRGFPEIDAIIGTLPLAQDGRQSQVGITPRYLAYLKICESCYNHCSFCAIPQIKGRFVSRSIESILEDVRSFDGRGVRELNIVGQDVTAYGMDLYRQKKLPALLKEIAATAPRIDWIRLLYAFPAHVTDELLEVMADTPSICKYIDMPLQHVNDRMLTLMNRNITRVQTEALIRKMRQKIPGASFRTAFIVGFPGETEAEFGELLSFIKDNPFDLFGAIVYSREESTPAASLKGQVSSKIKEDRLDRLMRVQESIAAGLQERMVGRTLKVLIEEKKKEKGLFVGRSEYDAPDVDGCVYVKSAEALKPGVFIDVKITAALGHDLEGKTVTY